MIRRTECACGQVSAVVEGDPISVFVCHCDYCQKRTGGVFAVTCMYPQDKVLDLNGETKIFSKSANSMGIQYEFCPYCGTTVHWTYGDKMEESFPGISKYRGFSVGCFADMNFPAPKIEHQRQYMHHWMPEIPRVLKFDQFADPSITMADL